MFQGDRFKLGLAFGRRLDWGQDFDAILGVEFLDELAAVPLFVRDHKEVAIEDGAGQRGSVAGDLGDRRAGGGGEGEQRLFCALVLALKGTDGFPIVSLLGDKRELHRLA